MAEFVMIVDTAVTVPVNLLPMLSSTDFVTVMDAIAYNAAGMDLRWNFVTPAGVQTSTPVTPTTGGVYDWTHKGDGIYNMEIPASGGASANNNTEGFGWFSGTVDGVVPFRGPVIQFSPASVVAATVTGASLGANLVTIIVNDNTATALEGATVTVLKGAEQFSVVTDVDGTALFSLNNGTWGVSITAPGFMFTPVLLDVDGAELQSYNMTLNSVTPSSAPQTTGYFTAFNAAGVATNGITYYLRPVVGEDLEGVGVSATDEYEATSAGGGIVQFPNLFKGMTYRIKRGTEGRWVNFDIPADAGSTYELTDAIVS